MSSATSPAEMVVEGGGLEPRKRPDWDTYFLQQAFLVAARSPDVHTQHGCIIVDSQKRVVSQVSRLDSYRTCALRLVASV